MTNLLGTICTKFLSESVRFSRRYDRKHFGVFFCFTLQFTVYSYIIVHPKVSWARLICHSH